MRNIFFFKREKDSTETTVLTQFTHISHKLNEPVAYESTGTHCPYTEKNIFIDIKYGENQREFVCVIR